jgi:hypothetical protein
MKKIFQKSLLLSLPLFVLAVIFHDALGDSPLLPCHDYFVLGGGILINGNVHQPSVFGMLLGEFAYCLFIAILLCVVFRSLQILTRRK